MNVAFVYPCVKNGESWNSLGLSFDSLFVNHGLCSMAATLQKHGHNVKVLDYREMRGWWQVEDYIKSDDSQVYGVHVPTLDYTFAVKTAKLIRRLKPNAHVVAGGPHASIVPESLTDSFDRVFAGEGEISFLEYVNNPHVKGPKVVRCSRPDLDALPYENREVFNMRKIHAGNAGFTAKKSFRQPFINVISGRGCVYRCGFCKPGEDLIFGRFRQRSLSNFLGEIQELHDRYKFRTLMIDDDSFTLYPNYVKIFCDEYKRKVAEPFICQTRADFVCRYPELVREMRDAGLIMFFIGLESGSQRMLDFMRKDTTVEQNFKAAEICRQNDIQIWANFMIGLPTETKKEMKATLDMIRKIKPEHPSGAFFTPIVGTELYDYCKTHDLLISDDPAVLGSRNPSVDKIKGVPYEWMRREIVRVTAPRWKRLARPVYRVLQRVKRKVIHNSDLDVTV